VSTKNFGQIAELEGAGAFLADTLIYTRNDRIDAVKSGAPAGYKIREAIEADADAIAQVAAVSFSGYEGHYHSDPNLRREDADEVYVSWARNCCINRKVADAVLVAETQGNIAGFGALRMIDEKTFDGVLFAVAPDHRRKGLLSALIGASAQWGVAQGFASMEYSTHLTNIAALNAVTGMGFRIDRSFHTFHRWVDAPSVTSPRSS